MDEVSFGIATAALTLQSVMLQALVAKGLLTPSEAVEVVDKSLDAVIQAPDDEASDGAAQAAHDCLEGVREAVAELADMPWPRRPN
jgi:rhamnogalacturonyl hydrolase YesR